MNTVAETRVRPSLQRSSHVSLQKTLAFDGTIGCMTRRAVLSTLVASASVSVAGCAVPSQSTDDPADLGPAGERGVSVTEYDPDDGDVSVPVDETMESELVDC